MDNTAANRSRITKAADLLAQAATVLEELENEVGEDDFLHEAYENAYGGMCALYNRRLEMWEAKMEDDLGSLVHDPDVVADWKRRNPV